MRERGGSIAGGTGEDKREVRVKKKGGMESGRGGDRRYKETVVFDVTVR